MLADEKPFVAQRGEVFRLLQEGTSNKLLRSGTEGALRKIQAAYDSARQPTPLGPPWLQLTAYRLAHLKFRTAKSEDLSIIEGLFGEAAAGDFLGVLPIIYRIAALYRLKQSGSTGIDDVDVDTRIDKLFERAKNLLAAPRERQSDPQPVSSDMEELKCVQGSVLNMLELTSYFLALEYHGLDGLSTPFEDLRLKTESWHLLGGGAERVDFPFDLAYCELLELEKTRPTAIVFILSVTPEEEVAKLRCAGKDWKEVDIKWLKLLECALRPTRMSKGVLEDYLYQDSHADPSNNRRQLKSRLQKHVAGELGLDKFEIFESTRYGADRVVPGVPVFGIVQSRLVTP